MRQLINLSQKIFLIVIFCALSIYVVTSLLSSFSRNESSYLAASLDKEKLLDSINYPRIIFVGGSNLALGLNSKYLSEETGYSVINMGLHGGLGLDFPLNEVKSKIRPKDIVILSIEHFLDKPDKKLLAQIIDINQNAQSLLALSWIDKAQLIIFNLQRSISSSYYKLINRQKDPIYYREAFTSQGDLISHFGKPKPAFVSGGVVFSDTNYSKGIEKINMFIEHCQRKGAKVYFIFPAYQKSAYNLNEIALRKLAHQYQAYLKCSILGDIETFVFDDKYFFDTVYHLDSAGVQKRTKIVFDLLQQAQPKITFPKKN
ncbi:hypothetical protein GCM10027341_38490 [Spirosoma knui]